MNQTDIEQGISDIVHCVAGPIIVYETSWAEHMPDWFRPEIKTQRLLQQMVMRWNPDAPKLVTDIETLAYMYPLTMVHPLEHDWVEIYTWLTVKCMREARRPNMAAVEKIEHPEELTDHQKDLLRGLQQWLWDRYEKLKKNNHKKAQAAIVGDQFTQLTLRGIADEGQRGSEAGQDERGSVVHDRGSEGPEEGS